MVHLSSWGNAEDEDSSMDTLLYTPLELGRAVRDNTWEREERENIREILTGLKLKMWLQAVIK